PGQYQLKVSMQGYKDFVTTIQMTSNPMNLNVNLEPAVSLYTLSVTANVAGAQVYINNVASGNAPLSRQLAPGSYSIRVSAPGFEDYIATVVVNGNTSHAAMLQPIRHQVTINSNVNGAQVYVNNAYVGTTPYTGTYAPGSYTVRLTAPGYQDASTVINLNRSDSITIVLQPAFATVNIYLNPAYLDPQNRNAMAQIKVFIDGNMQNGTTFQLPAGRHNLRITSGSFSASGDFDIAAGRTYTIEPVFSIQMR
ncbi:MAG TPA: PEGA domain-containing protein, partial [Spirochaetia bacterium]|nr:PEGA domain-containing protein [Spirochaetia bacterium]